MAQSIARDDQAGLGGWQAGGAATPAGLAVTLPALRLGVDSFLSPTPLLLDCYLAAFTMGMEQGNWSGNWLSHFACQNEPAAHAFLLFKLIC
jgi:hypothetical protein